MNYHPEALSAKYHFVRRVGGHLKIKKKMCSEMVYSMYSPFERCHGKVCRINEILVLVFKRGDIWLFL